MDEVETSKPPAACLPAANDAPISRDKAVAGLGVDHQGADCRALAHRLGCEVVAVFVDNDISAYDRRKMRPPYWAMVEAVRSVQVRGIVA
ncbi:MULTISPECIES: hypothetical protein [unclassified Frondihabitans]|uniref:hypothetical protein n=1 Tax=unclassified Frondihabitans TaxID=2626248 RepID=UPI000F4FE9F5|nr:MULTISPECIES: hypothetical protein [unclassified Frondihabitans]